LGHGDRAFLRMNANAYLGLNADPRVIAAEEAAAQRFGTDPGKECQHAY
jgi:glycine C-acetyltransferase